MLVVVIAVHGVLMTVVQVVDVVTMRHGFVAALLAVSVLVGGVLRNRVVLVVVVLVQRVAVVVVQVIDVIAVRHGLMAAVVTVLVLGGAVMNGVNVRGAHDGSFRGEEVVSLLLRVGVFRAGFPDVLQSVRDDVRDMEVGDLVDHFLAVPDRGHQTSTAQRAQMLRDERLRHARGLGERAHRSRLLADQAQ